MKKIFLILSLSLLFIIPQTTNAASFNCPQQSGYKLSAQWNGEISKNDYKGWYTAQCSYEGGSGEIELFAKANWVQDEGGEAIPCGVIKEDNRKYSDSKQVFILFDKIKETQSAELIKSMMSQAEALALPCEGADEPEEEDAFEEDAFEDEGDVKLITVCLMVEGGDCFDMEVPVNPESDAIIELDKFCEENPDDTVMCGGDNKVSNICLMTSPPRCWNEEKGMWEDSDAYVEKEPLLDNFCLMTDPVQCWNKEKEAWEEVEDYAKDNHEVERICIMTDPPSCWNEETGRMEQVEDYDRDEADLENFCLMTDPPKCWNKDTNSWETGEGSEIAEPEEKGIMGKTWSWIKSAPSKMWNWITGLF